MMRALLKFLPATSIFLGALLLFAVQPLIARFILPWFGGAPAVWTTCMLFFQAMLLAGYAYAHLTTTRLSARNQAILHILLTVGAVALLPIIPADRWKPASAEVEPVGRILALLAVTLGLPYFLLASTGPLVQAWLSRQSPEAAPPWRLYALSNLASLIALAAYPFVLEPLLTRQGQAMAWSIGFALFAVLIVAMALVGVKDGPLPSTPTVGSAHPARTGHWGLILPLWLLIPAVGVIALLATTAKVCLEVAVVPFLWVLPLAIYLVSFILAFDSPRWYHRAVWMTLLPVAVAGTTAVMFLGGAVPMWLQVAAHAGAMFVVCMICHGELYRLRPDAKRLTLYYLAIAAGGAVGGAFVAVGAPLLFVTYFEYPLAILLCMVLVAAILWVDGKSPLRHGKPSWAWFTLVVGSMLLGYLLLAGHWLTPGNVIAASRNFYGVLSVVERDAEKPTRHLLLRHGGVSHGLQFTGAGRRQTPTAYYGPTSGIGRTLSTFRAGQARRIGVVGLGTGTLAAWAGPADSLRFYEINPKVLAMARERFGFLKDSPARAVDHVLGDARLSLEREAPQRFDVLALDAFSGDAIPVHLLTRQAFEIYDRHLSPRGAIAVHISNQHLDLRPVLQAAAAHLGMGLRTVYDDQSRDNFIQITSVWVVMSRDVDFLLTLPGDQDAPWGDRDPQKWSDDYSSLLPLMR